MSISPVRLNHAVLFVADLERSVAFYSQAFGMTVMAREPRANAAFLRLPRSGNHHDLGLFGVGAQPPRARGGLGLYHLAWQVDTIEDLSESLDSEPRFIKLAGGQTSEQALSFDVDQD